MNFRQYFLKEANITTDVELLKALEQELDKKSVEQNSPIRKWFKTQYLKWFKSDIDDDKKPLKKHDYKQGEPEWMSGETIMDFDGFNNAQQQKIAHMIDYFKSLDPKDLESLYKEPLNVIQKKIADWDLSMRLGERRKSTLVEGVDFKPIRSTKDKNGKPMRWVQLITKKAYKFEGNMMHHCVGGYNPGEQGIVIISLYDADNQPRTTLEVNGKKIVQIKAEHNGAPPEEYQAPCIEFIRYLINIQKYVVTGDGDNIGMIKYDKRYYFEDSASWSKIFQETIIPKQQAAFEEIKKRIKIIAFEQFEYVEVYLKQLLKEDCRTHV